MHVLFCAASQQLREKLWQSYFPTAYTLLLSRPQNSLSTKFLSCHKLARHVLVMHALMCAGDFAICYRVFFYYIEWAQIAHD
jgi:hypothetical protein